MEYYSKKIINRFLHPKNLGKIKDADGVGDTTNLRCGDLMKIYIKVDKKKNRARNNAYALLRLRPRSESEIRRRLKEKGYDGTIINEVIADLKHAGDIDDEKFAKFWIESRMHMNPVGDVVLKHELKEKGISDSIIEATLDLKAKNYDEYEVAFSMARERFERFKKLDRSKAAKRLYDFLMRKGFKYENIRRIIEKLTNVSHED